MKLIQIRDGRRQRLTIGILVLAFFAIIGGCSANSRHSLLTIVFTGVAPLEEDEQSKDAVDSTVIVDEQQAIKQKQFENSLMPQFWAHGPFSAGQCERCHNVTQSVNFQGDAASVNYDPFTSGTAVFGARLAVPKNRLCVSCHTSHGAQYAQERSLVQHLPVELGNCTACHHPHQSRRQFMLLGEDDRQMCTGCHQAGKTEGLDHIVSEPGSCTQCHNSHIGTNSNLLKRIDDELSLLYSTSHRAPGR